MENILKRAAGFGIVLSPGQASKVFAEIEEKKRKGFQFTAADASLRLIMMRCQENYCRPFELFSWRVISEGIIGVSRADDATVRISVNGKNFLMVGSGNGPVNALDKAIREVFKSTFPKLENVKLTDWKPRVLSGEKGTAATVRTLLDFSNGVQEWTTVGCSTDSIEADLQALLDGYEYAILRAF